MFIALSSSGRAPRRAHCLLLCVCALTAPCLAWAAPGEAGGNAAPAEVRGPVAQTATVAAAEPAVKPVAGSDESGAPSRAEGGTGDGGKTDETAPNGKNGGEDAPGKDPARAASPAWSAGSVGLRFNVGNISGSEAFANQYTYQSTGPMLRAVIDAGKGDVRGGFEAKGGLNAERNQPQGFRGDFWDVKGEVRKIRSYKLRAYSNQYGHNLSDGQNRMAHVGSSHVDLSNLPTSGPATNFTYNKRRTNLGIEGEVSWNTPFFASIRHDYQKVEGLVPAYNMVPYTKPLLVMPLGYQTNLTSAQAGYRDRRLTLVLDGSVSSLDNDYSWITAESVAYGNGGSENFTYRKKPISDSLQTKFGGALSWRLPEWATSLMVRASQSRLTGDNESGRKYHAHDFQTETDDFDGRITNTYVNAALTTSPLKGFTGRIYYNYHDRDNDSSVKWGSASHDETDIAKLRNGMYSFTRQTLGLELSQRFLDDWKITAGYEWSSMERDGRYVFGKAPDTRDHRLWTQLNSEVTDWLGLRLRYQYLKRKSHGMGYAGFPSVPGWRDPAQAAWYMDYMSPIDTAGKEQHQIKAGADFSLSDTVGLSLDHVFKLDDYSRDLPLGMNRAVRNELIADLSWTPVKPLRLGAYGGVEYSRYTADYRKYSNKANADPSLGVVGTAAYNWEMKQKDVAYMWGAYAEWEILSKELTFKLTYDGERADGRTDFNSQQNLAGLDRVSPVDDYTRNTLEARLTWNYAENQNVGLGYRLDKYTFKDWSYAGVSDPIQQSMYAVDRDYTAHTGFVTWQYRF